jgi:para-nitrobenzyl esterase
VIYSPVIREVVVRNAKPWALFVVLMGSPTASAAINDPVRLQDGLISGVPGTANGVRVFKGIPFAAPPVGNLRWRAPQPVAAWDGVRKADAFSKICTQIPRAKGSYFQLEFESEPEPSGEDCLYLNVWTAAQSPDEKRPVMVWIYGGAFLGGSGSTPAYSGAGLAEKGAVVVTLNYRLGVFGLLAHPELTSESGHNASGNYALMDQIAALKWVQSNITAFGGDPRRITIFGQSAGSISIASLLTSPLADGLFQRAVGESDFATGTGPGNAETRRFTESQTLREAEQQGVEFGKKVGATTLAALRAMPAGELLKTTSNLRWSLNSITDGYVIPKDVYAAYAADKQIKVPLLLGSVANERANFPHPKTLQDYLNYTRRQFPDAFDEVMRVFPASNDDEATRAYLSRERDIMAADMRVWAQFMSRDGGTAYLYYFTRKPPARAGETPLGAVHTSDIVYFRNTLDTVDRPWTPQDRKLSDVMSSYLVNFATTGNPNGAGLPNWAAYKAGEVMELGDNIGPILTPDARELDWLDAYVARQLARRH